MAVALPRTNRLPSWRRAGARGWAAVTSIGARLNGSALPTQLDAADRAELERTIFG